MSHSGHAAERRQEILAAAQKVFDACGYTGATVEAVAVQAGIAKGSVYNYFQNKQELFVEVFRQSLAADEADADRLIAQQCPAGEKLRRMLDDWFEDLERYQRIGRLVLEFWSMAAREERAGRLASTLQEVHGRWRQRLARIITQGIDSGQFSPEIDPSMAAAMIIALSNGLTVQSILDVGVAIDRQVLEAMKRAIMVALTSIWSSPQEKQS